MNFADENLTVLLQHTTDIAIRLSLDFNILYLNPTAELYYQWQAGLIIGKNYIKLCQKQKFNCPLPLDTRSLLQGAPYTTEQLLSNGSFHYLSWKISRLLDCNSTPAGYLLLASPAQIARQAEHDFPQLAANPNQDLAQAQYFQNIMANLPEHIYWKDKKGAYVGCNDSLAQSMGFTMAQELVGYTLTKLAQQLNWKPKMLSDILATDNKVLNTGETIIVEEQMYWADGSPRTMLSKKVPLKDNKNNIIGLLGISTDITLQKNVEVELREAKRKAEAQEKLAEFYLNTVIANLPDHVYWETKEGIFLGCNDQQAKSLGFSCAKELIGKSLREVLINKLGWDEERYEAVRKNDLRVMQTGVAESVEEEVIFSDNAVRKYLSRKTPLKDESGKTIGILGISIDITERKVIEDKLRLAKEEADAANLAKSNFIASMSHDLKTPLVAILGISEILKSELQERKYLELIEDIEAASNNILSLVNEILGLSKLESGKVEFSSEPFDFRDSVEVMVSTLAYEAMRKNIDLFISYPNTIPRLLISDPSAVRRIILNLLGNAIKFTETGYVYISVELLSIKENLVVLNIKIKDTGVGIPEDKLGEVFERFVRVDPSYKGQYQGSGLGLSIVRQLATALGGEVSVESTLGRGSTFTCTLPFKKQRYKVQLSRWERKYAHLNLLVINDDPVNRKIISQQLDSNNVKVVSGLAALKELRKAKNVDPYHIAIIDNQLKNTDPIELAKMIKSDKSLVDTVLIYTTAPLNLENATLVRDVGFSKTIIKPIQPSELLEVMVEAWETRLGINKKKISRNLEAQLVQSPGLSKEIKKSKSISPTPISNQHLANHHYILLVEDGLVAQKVTKLILEKLKCRVDTASNGADAVALCQTHTYDMIFLDIGLPDIDGIEVCKRIRASAGPNQNIPIIALSGHIIDREEAACLRAGMNGFMEKPAVSKDFMVALSKYLPATIDNIAGSASKSA